MSSITINGDTSGSVILQAPSVAGSTTLTLPSTSGTVITTATTQSGLPANIAGNGPAFSAYNSSAQSIANNTFTKVQFQTKSFDTNSNFDNATNYRFTPTVAGYYHVTEQVGLNSLTANSFSAIYKNGGAIAYSPVAVGWSGIANTLSSVAIDIYMNGTTDYLEVYAYQASGGALNTINAANATMFSAFLARGA